jgi:hypothetical protein
MKTRPTSPPIAPVEASSMLRFGFDNDVINIHLYQVSNEVPESLMDGTHKGRKSIPKTIRHGDITKEVIYYYKSSMFFTFSRHWYLMET